MDLGIKRIRGAWAALPLELVAGVILFAQGFQQISNPAGLAVGDGISSIHHILILAAEFGGGSLLLAGLFVRLGAIGQFGVMAVAIVQDYWGNAMPESGSLEFSLALLATAIALLILGGDPLSIDDNIRIALYRSRTA